MPQSNLALIYEDMAARATLSGGGWQPGSLKLANLRTPYLAEIARSSNASPANSQFDVDLGAYRTIGGIALGGCQVTPFAQYRLRAFINDASGPVGYDTGVIPFPGTRVDQQLLDWEDPGFWEGVSQEFDDRRKGSLLLHIPPESITARVWRVEIIDPGHPANRIDIGRLIMGRLWQPAFNYTYDNNSLDFEALTDVEESRTGTRFYNARNLRRIFSFGFDFLPEADTLRDVYRIATRSGIHNQVVVAPDPSDITNFQRDAFIGTLSVPPSLRRAAFQRVSTSYKIEEVL
ncbi:hypothetical protein [Methylorubrum aminovorans]|uniref:hypothetical protein n=1 Tax=Methylorubrum aminovorans TaxID=269069 RepID=UPI003C30A699